MSDKFDAPQSRNEAILQNILGANNTLGEPQSRIEALLMQLLEQGGGGSGGSGGSQTEIVAIDSDGDVTQALDAGKIYVFKGSLTSLTITLNATDDLPQYHFSFITESTAPTLTVPSNVVMPAGFSVDGGYVYEVDILKTNNDLIRDAAFATVASWEVSA